MAHGIGNVSRVMLSVFIVLFMVGSSFFVLATTQEIGPPMVWTDKEEYRVGEPVLISGKGFWPVSQVTITLTHSSFPAPRVFIANVDSYGRFLLDIYAAEHVEDPKEPIVVTAYQDATHQATTEFWEPDVTLLAWNVKDPIKPSNNQRWMKGDIKGYNEGDSVPMRVDVSGSAAGGPGRYINFTIAIDYLDFKGYYGFDGLARMWDWTGQVPDAPYNIYSINSQPFWVDPSQGMITWQSRIENAYPVGGDSILEQNWQFNMTVFSDATVRFGAHLAVTDLLHGILGASYYEGCSLHVRIANYTSNFSKMNEGNRDVPFAITTILGPPQMHLEKSVDHSEVVEGQIITFTIHFNNTGEAEAQCVNIWDNLPYVAEIVPGSFLFWTQGKLPMAPVPAPTITDPQHWSWYIGCYPGVGNDGSSPVIESYLSFRALVNTSDEGYYKNWVYLSYTDDHGGDFSQLEAWAEFCIKGIPSIDVEKVGPEYAHVNETLTYWINVTNDGAVNLTDVDVVDDVLGVIAQDITLDKGETRSFVVTHKVLPTDPDPMVNNVTATGYDRYGRQVNDTANHTVDILHPEIVVTKSSTKSCAKIGEKVWYTITVRNPSTDTDLFDVTVDDNLLGFHWSVPEFDAGEWEIFYPYIIVSEANEDPLENIVHASGVDITRFQVTDDATWTVDILHPSVSLVKYANLSCAAEGETVRYWVNVSNPSGDTPMMVYLNDTMEGPLFAGVLAPGQYENISYDYTVKAGDPTVIVNEAKVVAYDRQGHYVNVSVSWVLDVVHPSVEITKTANLSCAGIGETVMYTVNVTNPAWTDVWLNGTIFDPLLGLERTFTDLKPGVSILLNMEYTVKPTDGVQGPLTNVAWVVAYDHQLHLKTAGASVNVDVVHPDIVVTKSANVSCAGIGEVIGYTITVINPISADVWLNGTAHDAMLEFEGNFSNLRPGHSISWKLNYTVKSGDGLDAPLTNVAWVEACDHQMHLVTDQSNPVYVDIVHPAVEITKESDKKCAAPDENVMYWINVTNPKTADVWLNGTARDLTVGVFWNFFNLIPGQTVSFSLNVSMPRGMDTYTNIAEVQAFDHQWHYLRKTATVTVDIVHPDIQITKQVNVSCAAIGENVTYTITVTNPSWTDVWMNGTMYDDLLGLQESFANLTPGESVSWIVEYTIKAYDGLQGPLENQARVVAYDHQLHEQVNWSGIVYVDVVHPDVQVTKRANLTCAGIGESVNYTITVINPRTADVWLNGTVYDSMLDWSSGFTNLKPGESRTWNVEYIVKVTDGVEGYLANIAWVDAFDHQKHLVTNSSGMVLVDVVHPDIQILKTADKDCAHQGEEINFTIKVTNPASADVWMNGTVYDPLLQWVWTFTNLTPGSSVSKTMSYNVSIDYALHWLTNSAWVEAYDHQLHLRVNRTYKDIEILHPQIEVTKVGPELARSGQLISYNVTVTNTGDTDLYGVVVWDSLFALPIGSFAVLPIGWTEYINYTYLVLSGEGTVENLVTASGHDKQDVWVNDRANWTVVKLVMIDGHVYADLNKNMAMGLLEPGLYNWLVVLTGTKAGGGSVFNTTQSDTYGFYQFLDLEPGTYTVTEMLEADWYNISMRVSLSMTLVSGGSATFDIGNLPYVNITGCKWADMNFNGLRDPNEVTIPNWNISLDGIDYNGAEVHLRTTTGSDGCYAFLMLLPGIYNVSEELRAGWLNTTSATRHIDVGTLEPANMSGINFGNVKLGTSYGFKFRDDNMNGYQDGSDQPGNQNGYEPRLPGWVIELTGTLNNGSSFGPVYDVTDEYGVYQFDNLFPGEYTIREIMKSGWTNITPDSYNVTMVTGGYFHCGKFGNLQFGSIQGWKYVDWDMDRVMDTNEPGIEGWNVTLTGWLNDGWPSGSEYRATPVGPITIQTSATGYWNFSNLLPGFYIVTEETRTNWFHVTPSVIWFDINSGTHVIDVKFGNVPYTCIWGYKFNDINGDGQNESEPGLVWTIELRGERADGTPVWIVMDTGSDGYFATCFNVLPGEYYLYELQDPDWMPTTPWIYELNLSEVTVPSAMYREFGNFELGKIGGYKYVDVNGDGLLDGGDVAKQGWTIYLSDGIHVSNTTTNENGWFEFTGLHAGTYSLWEENRTNWVHTSPAVVTGILITSGAVSYTTIFLNTELSKIWGYKFEDLNSNGIWDQGEPGVVNWTIWLWWDGVPPISTKTDASGYYEFPGLMPAPAMVWENDDANWTHTNVTWESFVVTSGTDRRIHDFGNFHNVKICAFKFEDVNSDGYYSDYGDFPDKPLANWSITFTGPGLGAGVTVLTGPDGYACLVVTHAGFYNVTEEERPGWTHTTAPTRIEVYVESNCLSREAWFGNFHNVDITVFKYEDMNSNGEYDEDVDIPLRGWNITLWELDDHLYAWILVSYAHTDWTGHAVLVIDNAGSYVLNEALEDGWVQTDPESGYYLFYAISGEVALGGDIEDVYMFGNFHCVEILILKYWDRCSSGFYEPVSQGGIDLPLVDWNFTITAPDGTVMSARTNETGYISFMACMSGTYIITEEDKEGWSHISPESGTLLVDVTSGDGLFEVRFGNYLHVDITIFKYEDVNSNGRYDVGLDRPIQGWNFSLEGIGGYPIYSGATGPNGYLVLTVNKSGLYYLSEESRPDWVPTNGSLRLLDIISGTQFPVQEFGNFHKVHILVFKFDDINANGEFDGIEEFHVYDQPIQGWNITLWEYSVALGDWIPTAYALTNESGLVEFVIDHAGWYAVTEEDRAGWFWISPALGYYTFHVCSGEQEKYFEFANFKLGTIFGCKYNDLDGDGQYDPGEPTMANWTITIQGRGPNGVIMTRIVKTNETGCYMVTGVPPGLWTVTEEVKDGWVNTSAGVVEVQIWGHREARVDFFNFAKGCIDGYKYEDMNGNGERDAGDVPKHNWSVSLYIITPHGPELLMTKQTDESGYYRFCGIGPGTYVVMEEVRSGWTNTSASYEVVPMTSGLYKTVHDFLNVKYSKIWGYKFEDTNSNGVRDAGEFGVENWTIWLWWDGVPPISTTTDASGYYEFAGLMPAPALVWENDDANWTHTNVTWESFVITSGTNRRIHDFGNFENVKICIWKFEDVNGNGRLDEGDRPLPNWNFTITGPAFSTPLVVSTNESGRVCVIITKAGEYNVSEESRQGWVNTTASYKVVDVTSGILLRPLKFGNFELARLVVKKYYDSNVDGHDDSEPGLDNWPITVQPLGVTLYTDTDGYLTLDGLGPGAYVVSEALPAGWKNTTPSVINVGSVTSGQVVSLSFGNVVLGNITGCKFYDKDMDGIRDDNEPLLSGWTIHLDGVTDWGLVVNRTTITNATGYYKFVEVQPGLYTVSEELKSCFWINTSRLVQTVDVSGLREEFNETRDFGNMRYSVIYGYKFLDTYAERYPYWPNGVFDENETGIGNWRITLEGRTLTGQLVQLVAYTNNTDEKLGYYRFGNLLPGDYWVNETLLSDWWATTPYVNLVRIYADWRTPVIMRIDFGNLLPEPDPEMPFVLTKGWNMWSSPMTTTDAMYASDLAAKIGPTVIKISRLNTATGMYESFLPGVTTPRSALDFQILYGVGYYIVVRSDTYFTLTGTLHPTSSLDLAKGWNIVGYTTLVPMKASDLASHVSGCMVYKVTYLDSATGKYYSYIPGVSSIDKDFIITSGRAYFVVTNAIGTLGLGT
jgi:uncharacterized repeat protein (TIGR01451 family)